MKAFKAYHPIVNFVYFAFIFIFSCSFVHPICLCISFLSAFAYSILLNGVRAVKFNLIYMLPMMIFAAILNPVFNHEGVTILTYLPGGNPLTAESIANGTAVALMLGAVVLWFSCFNKIMTSDKFVYLFSKFAPSLSLMLSMVLRFVPKFKTDFENICGGQKCIGCDISEGGIIKRTKNGVKIISIMITLTLENAIQTADSMKSRGYGLANRTSFSIFKFTKRDTKLLLIIGVLALYIVLCSKNLGYQYLPIMQNIVLSPMNISIFSAYLLLFTVPIFIEISEELKWKLLKSKI